MTVWYAGRGPKEKLIDRLEGGRPKFITSTGEGDAYPFLIRTRTFDVAMESLNCTLLHKNASLSHLFESEKNQES